MVSPRVGAAHALEEDAEPDRAPGRARGGRRGARGSDRRRARTPGRRWHRHGTRAGLALPARQAADVHLRMRPGVPRDGGRPPPRLLAGGRGARRARPRRRLRAVRAAAPARARHRGDRLSGERYELPPERLRRWLDRWAQAHGGIAASALRDGGRLVTYTAHDGAVVACEPPFPPLADGDALLEHVSRERTVGVLLVRLGGHAAGIFAGTRLTASKTGARLVHGRHRAGGSSSGRFARRRAGQARVALQAAADVAAHVLREPAEAGRLDAVVLGGDRSALTTVLSDPRLHALRALAVDRVLDVPEPRLRVLTETPDEFRATIVRPR